MSFIFRKNLKKDRFVRQVVMLIVRSGNVLTSECSGQHAASYCKGPRF